MNTEKIENEKEEVLKIVNEDWPMLEELDKKRFLIKKKKQKDVQESLNVLQAVLDEDIKLSEEVDIQIANEHVVIEEPNIEKSVLPTINIEKPIATQDVSYISSPQNQEVKKITPSEIVTSKPQSEINVQLEKPIIKTTKQVKEEVVTEKSMDLFKLIVAGLTHLYVSKTSNLLKPIKFVMDNYKEFSIAVLHFVVPLLMTYFITTQVSFVTEQLIKESIFMKVIYIGIFFFGSTFVWISSQVLLSGLYSMIRKSMLDVAKVGKENQ